MNTNSTLIEDIEASISKAYDATLPIAEQNEIRKHLNYILPQLSEPHTHIEQIKAALTVMEARVLTPLPWFQRPYGVVALAVIGGLIVAKLAKQFGWV